MATGHWDSRSRAGHAAGWLTNPLLALLLMTQGVTGPALEEPGRGTPAPASGELRLPYAFFNDAFGGAVGYVYGGAGFLQPQATLLNSLIIGSNGAYALYMLSRDLRMPGTSRLFVDGEFGVSHFGTIRSYIDGNPSFSGQRAGSNESDPKDYVEGNGDDNLVRADFRYLLPIGSGRLGPPAPPALEGGLPVTVSGLERSWKPMSSGRTFLEVKPYWRSQSITSRYGLFNQKTDGIAFSLFWDNTDFPRSPSRGSTVRVRQARDWGWLDSSRPYVVNDTEFSEYFPLGGSPSFRQRTVALDAWTAQVPSWHETCFRDGSQVNHRPPAFLGPTLGGLWRMRGYPTARFNDEAAIYYALEYRVIPEWNPFARMDWVKRQLGIDWWQWVVFTEAGRVAPAWSFSGLHSDMRWDAGLGIRAMAKGVVVRVDVARSSEETSVSMMVGQPFQF